MNDFFASVDWDAPFNKVDVNAACGRFYNCKLQRNIIEKKTQATFKIIGNSYHYSILSGIFSEFKKLCGDECCCNSIRKVDDELTVKTAAT